MEKQQDFEFEEFEYNPSSDNFDESTKNDQENSNESHNQSQNLSNQKYDQLCVVSNQFSNNHDNNQQKWFKFVCIGPNQLSSFDTINLFNGLQVTNDGVIRYGFSLDQVSFGYQQQKIISIEDNERLGIINIQYSNDGYQKQSFQDALIFIQKVPNIQYDLTSEIFTRTSVMLDHFRGYLKMIVNDDIREEKYQEFQLYLRHCKNYLEYYCKSNPNQMFYYTILRLDINNGDSEIAYAGYSKPYLQLLGIDSDSFKQILLRNKKVDLIKNKQDIIQQALIGLQQMDKNLKEEYYESHITTFDGFPINLKQRKQDIPHGFETNKLPGIDCLFSFTVYELDVDLYDLQQLIDYRSRLVYNKDNLTYNDYLRKELSFKFEDVEYSVHSQLFVDKYYQKNIENLQSLKQRKNNRKQDHQHL